jgi:hypothetical protein
VGTACARAIKTIIYFSTAALNKASLGVEVSFSNLILLPTLSSY